MRRGLWVLAGGVIGSIGGVKTWLALCLSALAAIMLLVGGLDPSDGGRARTLHHDGLALLAWTWGVWAALSIATRLRRR